MLAMRSSRSIFAIASTRLKTLSAHLTSSSSSSLSSTSMEWRAEHRPCQLVVVGGVAGGSSAAARARRLDEHAKIIVVEKGRDVSFANCGMPYYLGGTITDAHRLNVQTPQSLHQLLNLEVRTRTSAVKIDRTNKTVVVKSESSGHVESLRYDRLVLSTGALPVVPSVPGVQHPCVFTLRSLEDMEAIKKRLDQFVHHPEQQRIVVVGAGFIGLEMVEQLVHAKRRVALVEREPHILPQVDRELVDTMTDEIRHHGVELKLADAVTRIEAVNDNQVTVHLSSGARLQADVVVLGIGVRPDTQLARDAGLKLTPSGHLIVNEFQQTSDPHIYAVGDAVTTRDGVLPMMTVTPLAGPANRQGRLAAEHIFMPQAFARDSTGVSKGLNPYPGSLGTAIVKCFDESVGVTGFSETRLKKLGNIPYRTTVVADFHHAGYYPDAQLLHVKICWCPNTGKLLGAQVSGTAGVDKRLDILATALRGGMTIQDLIHLELAYAPPFGSAKDIINLAGMVATNQMLNLLPGRFEVKPTADENFQIVDVRDREVCAIKPFRFGAAPVLNIPLSELRGNLARLDKSMPILTVCNVGRWSYFAARILAQEGFKVSSLQGGVSFHPELVGPPVVNSANTGVTTTSATITTTATAPVTTPPVPAAVSVSSLSSPPPPALTLNCSGMACPGPLMKLSEIVPKLLPGQVVTVTATDPGFLNDCKAFSRVSGLNLNTLTKEKGVITAVLQRPVTDAATPTSAAQPQGVVSAPSSTATACTVVKAAELSKASSAPSILAVVPSVPRDGASIICFSSEMDKVLAALVLANGACALAKAAQTPRQGPAVTIFFTFWGLNVLKKSHTSSVWHNLTTGDKSFMDRMFSMLMEAGHKNLPLSRLNFGGFGAPLMEMQMKSKSLPSLDGLLKTAQTCGVRLLACTMSMDAMGVKKEDLIDGVELGGVADFLASARDTDLKLFI